MAQYERSDAAAGICDASVVAHTGKKRETFCTNRREEMVKLVRWLLLRRLPVLPEPAKVCDKGEIEG